MPMIPFVKNGYFGSRSWIPFVNGNGLTAGGGDEPEPPAPVPTYTTVTGIAPLALIGAIQHDIRLLKQFGKCTQASTPTPDAPVDIVCNNGALRYSANMANVNEQTAMIGYYINAQGRVLADSYNWFYQAYIPVKPNTSYTLSMSQSVYYVTISEYSTAEDSGFIVRKNGSTGVNTSLTITTGATTNFIRFGTNIDRGLVTLEEVLGINWMLNLGGMAMSYQPYVEGGIYPDGTPEVLTVSGENLLDPSESNIAIGGSYSQGGEQGSAQNNWRTGFIPIEGGKTYAFWGRKKSDNTISAYTRINWFDADGNNISPRPRYTAYTVTVGTAPSNAAFAGLSSAPYNSSAAITRDAFDEYNWMFAEAAQEIPYEPYVQPQTVSVPMLLGVNDAYRDETELIHGIKTGKVGVYVFTGEEAFTKGTAFYTTNTSFLPSKAGSITPICTHFMGISSSASRVSDSLTMTVNGPTSGVFTGCVYFYADRSLYATTADFKAWLASQYAAGTPVIVLYPLATETTEQGTPHAMHTSEGDNIVDVTSNVDPVTLEVEYANGYE